MLDRLEAVHTITIKLLPEGMAHISTASVDRAGSTHVHTTDLCVAAEVKELLLELREQRSDSRCGSAPRAPAGGCSLAEVPDA
jgi:hypothetical protein